MKHSFSWSETRHNRKPLRSCKELAKEFGVTPQSLGCTFANYPDAPKPVINTRSTSAKSKACWYDPEEARRWWAKYQKQQEEK